MFLRRAQQGSHLEASHAWLEGAVRSLHRSWQAAVAAGRAGGGQAPECGDGEDGGSDSGVEEVRAVPGPEQRGVGMRTTLISKPCNP